MSGERFEKEFGRKIFVSYEEGVKKTVEYMKKHSSSFLNPEDSGAGSVSYTHLDVYKRQGRR